ncbi:hypothetical protein E2C01_021076 [Portunus trituberculatus]|uniref:Uncharacterized protein n=1 Tax=Portunus trituberculatus TaxID=210409 RepID=A0A5B7E3G7_PORTR|nr:hypothetical protein [Portunus trituberculatus]
MVVCRVLVTGVCRAGAAVVLVAAALVVGCVVGAVMVETQRLVEFVAQDAVRRYRRLLSAFNGLVMRLSMGLVMLLAMVVFVVAVVVVVGPVIIIITVWVVVVLGVMVLCGVVAVVVMGVTVVVLVGSLRRKRCLFRGCG